MLTNRTITLMVVCALWTAGYGYGQTPVVFEDQHLFASDGAEGDQYGRSVSAHGEVAIIGSFTDDTTGGVDAGSVYVYRFDGTTWVEEAHLFASDGATGDYFGLSVAVSGAPGSEVAIVGANHDDTAAGSDAGSVYIYRFNGTTWAEDAHLFASDGASVDLFGGSVSILNGNVVIVGAILDDTLSGTDSGSAYIYRYDGTVWVEEAHLFASDGMMNDSFGWSVSISGIPGNEVAIVGVNFDNTAAGFEAGSVYIYRFNGTTWAEDAHLFATDGSGSDGFGSSVSVSSNSGSEIAIVGAWMDSTPGGTRAGSAYIYRFDGTTWVEETHLFASDGGATDFFGSAVTFCGTPGNEVLFVAAQDDATGAGLGAGSVYMFNVGGVLCPNDITPPGGNGVVNIDDLVAVLNAFGPCPVPPAICDADITPPGGNGTVNIDDLVAVLNAFGPCP